MRNRTVINLSVDDIVDLVIERIRERINEEGSEIREELKDLAFETFEEAMNDEIIEEEDDIDLKDVVSGPLTEEEIKNLTEKGKIE